MNTYLKFGLLVTAIIGIMVWLAAGGISDNKTYYKTISELHSMGDRAKGKHLRVGGDVQAGTIVRDGAQVRFQLRQDARTLSVVYTGTEPLPDTFRDNSQALADGRLADNGVFEASRVQAKCASKYEAKPSQNKRALEHRAGV